MKIIYEFVPACVRQKWYEVTAKRMMLNYEGVKNKGKLRMAIIDMCAVSVSIKVFCKSCYNLEGDVPLVLRGNNIFNQIEEFL